MTVNGAQVTRKAPGVILSLLLAAFVIIVLVFTAWSRLHAGFPRADFLNMPAGSVPIGVGTPKLVSPGNMCEKGSCTSTLPASRASQLGTAAQDINAVKASDQPIVQLNVTPTLPHGMEDAEDSFANMHNVTDINVSIAELHEDSLPVEQILENSRQDYFENSLPASDAIESMLEVHRSPQEVAEILEDIQEKVTEPNFQDSSDEGLSDASEAKEVGDSIQIEQ